MKTMQQQWQDYKAMVYKTGIPPEQNKECHQAFFAGALCVLGTITAISTLPEAEAFKAMATLEKEVQEICSARAMQATSRN